MNFKTKLFVLLLTFILLFPIQIFAAEKTKIYIEDAIKYENSDKVTVKIFVKNVNSNIVALGLNVFYDSSKLEVASSKAGGDLESILKHGENFPDEGKFSIAMISLTGFEKDGHYYTIIFNVKDDSDDIPLRLEVKEASDKNGNDVPVETENGKIVVSKENKTENNTNNNATQEKKIEEFTVSNVEELTSIENILIDNSNIEINEEDILSYEVENPNVIKVMEDGSLIVNENGESKVKVKVNGIDIGTIDVEVENGNIKKISGSDKTDKETYKEVVNDGTVKSSSNALLNESTSNNYEKVENKANYNSSNSESNSNIIKFEGNGISKLSYILGISFIIMLLIFIFIKNKRRKRRKKW